MQLTSELDAVNECLRTIGESPVNSLDSGYFQSDAALNVVRAVSREIQSGDWLFNRELKVQLSPDTSGEIQLGANVVRIHADYDPNDPLRKVTQRGQRLYDMRAHSFTFTRPVTLDIVSLLEWDDLPEVARQYITRVAAKQFQWQTLGSDQIDSHAEQAEQAAYVRLLKHDTETADYSIFDNAELAYITER